MRTADFDFELPPGLVAQTPVLQRDQSRLLVLHRDSGRVEHRHFHDLLGYLHPGDILVLNNSRVIPARLRGKNAHTGGHFEVLLLEENATNDWWALLRPGKRARVGTRINFQDLRSQPSEVHATVLATNDEGHRRLRFAGAPDIIQVLDLLGEVPLPPYIARTDSSFREQDCHRYQTVFAQPAGSVAAPTAGLHFTEALLEELSLRGVQVCFLTLHVGLGTFAPVKATTLVTHVMHEERFELRPETAQVINRAKSEGRRVVAIGTTTLRVLETLAAPAAKLSTETVIAGAGKTRLFVYPPYHFRVADALVTNFHLPRSTLLMLVSAFAAPGHTRGRDLILSVYAEAIRKRYRFFSYGDAMLVL